MNISNTEKSKPLISYIELIVNLLESPEQRDSVLLKVLSEYITNEFPNPYDKDNDTLHSSSDYLPILYVTFISSIAIVAAIGSTIEDQKEKAAFIKNNSSLFHDLLVKEIGENLIVERVDGFYVNVGVDECAAMKALHYYYLRLNAGHIAGISS